MYTLYIIYNRYTNIQTKYVSLGLLRNPRFGAHLLLFQSSSHSRYNKIVSKFGISKIQLHKKETAPQTISSNCAGFLFICASWILVKLWRVLSPQVARQMRNQAKPKVACRQVVHSLSLLFFFESKFLQLDLCWREKICKTDGNFPFPKKTPTKPQPANMASRHANFGAIGEGS